MVSESLHRAPRAALRVLTLLVVAALAGVGPAAAQEAIPAAAERGSALVLSGGGGRGIAHAGVLAGLEALAWEPSLVVGTSMGAIIGALYAAGYDGEAIRAIVEASDWGEMFVSAPLPVGPERELRHPILRMAVDLELGQFEGGFIPDWRINRLLARLLFEPGARARGDFDLLPRRYRAVAASLGTGEAVVLSAGDPARAARASMAVPGVFSPVVTGDDVLVDGGLILYLPTSVARSAGAGALVAVDVVDPPEEIDVRGPVDVASRALRLLIQNAMPDTLTPPEVLLVPPLPAGLSSATFPRDPTPLLEAGREVTVGIDLVAAGAPSAGRARPPLPLPTVAEVAVSGPPRGLREMAAHTLRPAALGPLDPQRVLRALDRLYATGLYSAIWLAVEPLEEPRPDLLVESPAVGEPRGAADADTPGATEPAQPPSGSAPPDTAAPVRLRVLVEAPPVASVLGGLGYDSDRGGRGWAAFQRGTAAAGRPAEWGLEGAATRLGRFAAISGRIHSLARPGLTWGAGLSARQTDVRVFVDGELDGELEVERFGGWVEAALRRLDPDRELRLTWRAERVETEDEEGVSLGPLLRLATLPELTRAVGISPLLEAEARWGEWEYWRAAVQGSLAGRLGPLQVAALAAGEAAAGDAPADALPALGSGPAPLPGLRWGEERGRARLTVGADVAYPVPLEGWVRLRLLAGTSTEGDLATDDAREEGRAGAALTGIWPTPWGPVEITAGVHDDGGWRLDLSVGPRFRH